MLPRAQRKRHSREPIVRKVQPIVCYDYLDNEWESLERRLEELRAWAVEQIRLKNLDDG